MDDIKTVVKELRRIADAGERIAKALEKQNKGMTVNASFSGEVTKGDPVKVKQLITEAIEESMKYEA